MAINLNKSEQEKPSSRFNLSKSKESPIEAVSAHKPVSESEPPNGGKSKLLLLLILGILAIAALTWFIIDKSKPSGQTEGDSQQVSAENPQMMGTSPAATAADSMAEAGTEETNVENSVPVQPVPYQKSETYKIYQFPFGSYDYSQPDPELDKLADVLKNNPALKISISAYTDNVGDANFNLTLSELRAKSINDYLVSKGIETSRMKYLGKGVSTKYASKAENRRAEFVLSE